VRCRRRESTFGFLGSWTGTNANPSATLYENPVAPSGSEARRGLSHSPWIARGQAFAQPSGADRVRLRKRRMRTSVISLARLSSAFSRRSL
jgi:hypothetical protein